jgi:putative glutamine amidotransferase
MVYSVARPVIGICTVLERARWSVWELDAALLPMNYVQAVQRAGGLALMLPPDEQLVEDPDEVLSMLDGLILAGGADIDPASYGEPRDPHTVDTVPERDRFEVALARGAIERDLPLLGICRGMQLINIACGGTLIQHLPDRFGHGEHRRVVGTFEGSDHEVKLTDGSLAQEAAGQPVHTTKSHHHQGVDCLGAGLVVTGTSVFEDELAEAIELPGKRFVLGVQWHPEVDPDSSVIASLVAAAARSALAAASE